MFNFFSEENAAEASLRLRVFYLEGSRAKQSKLNWFCLLKLFLFFSLLTLRDFTIHIILISYCMLIEYDKAYTCPLNKITDIL